MAEQTQPSASDLEARIIARAWRDEGFRRALLAEPKATLKREFDVEGLEGVELRVIEEQPNTAYLILPPKPDRGEAGVGDADLAAAARNHWTIGLCVSRTETMMLPPYSAD